MKFFVKAVNASGSPYTAVVEARDKTALYGEFHAKGEVFISATEVKTASLGGMLSFLNNLIGSVKLHEKVLFARNLSAMLGAGLALSKALSVLERQTRNKNFKKIISAINDEVSRGGTLSSGLAKYPKVFPSLFVAMVRSGEESGGLTEALSLISNQMEKSYLLIKKVKGAMIYPAIIFLVMISIGILMLIYVVPALTKTFEELNVPLPKTTQMIVAVSNFLTNHTVLFLVGVVALVLLVIGVSKTRFGKRSIDYSVTRIPLIGEMVKETNAARTARTLSSLLSAGVEVVGALAITEEVIQNSFYKKILRSAGESIQKGSPISSIFLANEHLYPPLVGEMISVGEETGQLSDMLLKLALFYEGEVEQKTKDLSSVIEPFLMVFIGVAVGFFAIAMISPTYSLVNVIN